MEPANPPPHLLSRWLIPGPSQPSGFALILATLLATFLFIFSIFVSLEIHLFWLFPHFHPFIRPFTIFIFPNSASLLLPNSPFPPNTSSFVQFSVPSTAGHLQFPFFSNNQNWRAIPFSPTFCLAHFSISKGHSLLLLLRVCWTEANPPFALSQTIKFHTFRAKQAQSLFPFPFYRYPFHKSFPPSISTSCDVPHFLRISRLIAPQSAIHSRTFQPATMIGMGVFCHPFCLRLNFFLDHFQMSIFLLIPSVIHSFPQFHILHSFCRR